MKRSVCSVSMLVALGFAGRAVAAADVPAWCSAIGDNRVDTSGNIKDTLEGDDPRNVIKNLVGRMCKPDDESKAQMKELEATRQKWSQKLDMVDADWSDAAEYATLGQGERMNGEVYVNTMGQKLGIGDTLKRAWTSFDALDQWAMFRADAGASGDMSLDKNYLADALGAKLTETGRAAYVQRCVQSRNNGPVQWSMCQGDLDKLDLKKVAGELRANKAYSGADKMRVRIELFEFKPKLAAHAAKVKQTIAGDPGYGKVFEVGETARKEWEARAKSDAALIELATAMDDARALNSRRAFADCEDKTWPAWKSAMATVPAKKFEGMHDDRENGKSFVDTAMGPISSNPSVYLASVAYVTCMTAGQERHTKHDFLVRALGDAMERWPGYRGPRTATQTAILSAGITLDDRDAKLEYPSVSRSFGGGGGSRSGGGDGVIGSLKPSGKTVTVTFKKQMVKQVQCAQVKYTRRVTQIRPDGTLVYEAICTKNETVTVDKSDSPQTVNAKYMVGVKPGMFLSNIEDVVTVVRAKPGSAIPTMVFGVALK